MSEKHIAEILDKFAGITSIIIETSKIKEFVDRNPTSDALQEAYDRIKTEVDSLNDEASSIKDLFCKLNKHEIVVNGNVETVVENDDEKSDDTEKNSSGKPVIKLVDIQKLVDPKSEVKSRLNPVAFAQKEAWPVNNSAADDSVLVISSSDEETAKISKMRHDISKKLGPKPSEVIKVVNKFEKSANKWEKSANKIDKSAPAPSVPSQSQRTRPTSRRKAAVATAKKIERVFREPSSSSSGDEDSFRSKRPSLKSKNKNFLENATLSDASMWSETSSTSRRNKSSKKSGKTNEPGDYDGLHVNFNWKNDIRLKSKCYVRLVKIPCDKLKDYYLEKMDLVNINKLTNLNSLKRKKGEKSEINSSASETDISIIKKKSKNDSTVQEKSRNSDNKSESKDDNVNDDLGRTQDQTLVLESDKPENTLFEDGDNPENSINTEIERALELICSENESGDENPITNEDDDKASDKEAGAEETEANKKDDEASENGAKLMEEDKSEETLINDSLAEDGLDRENNKVADLDKTQTSDKGEDSEVENDQTISNDESKTKNLDDDDKNQKSRSGAESEDGNKKKKSGSDDESEDGNKNKNAGTDNESKDVHKSKKVESSKSSWKKDKLLTDKLSSTDSEAEFENFSKKKKSFEEKKDASSDDEVQIINEPKKSKNKKKRKKKIFSDSESGENKSKKSTSSSSSSSESDKEKNSSAESNGEKSKRPRKRVKRVRDSSDEENDEKSTRKQIRQIWGRDSLAETTKKAEAEEKERKARIADKQKKYNQSYENNTQQSAAVEKVVLDYDDDNQQELLSVDSAIVSKLKPHQASGIQFMWDACFESTERAKSTVGSGCILAHCMGLGKTLQVIALTHALLTNFEKTNVKKVMVVSPLNTVLNWVAEYKQWMPESEDFDVYELVSLKQVYERQYQVKDWHNNGGVLIIGYDMFRNLSNPDNKRLSKKVRATFQEALVDPGPDIVICDEGHLLKNEKTNLSVAMNRLKTLRRIVLTGTPLQNNLKEYFCMVQFIKPNLLGTYKEYLNRFVNPIINGQYTDSTLHDIQLMRKRSHILHKLLDGIVQRRDYSVLAPYLPPKHEYVLFLTLTETQIKLYRHYMNHYARKSADGSNKTSFLFVDFQSLQRICTHPRVLLDKSIENKLAKDKLDDSEEESEGSLKDFINDNDEDESSRSSKSGSGSSSDDGGSKEPVQRKRVTRAARAAAKEKGEDLELEVIEEPQEKEWWQDYCDGDELNVIEHGTKLKMLFEILKECEQIGDKVLVFSQSLYSLNIIEYFLARIHDATQDGNLDAVGGFSGSWCSGLDYFRLDGSSSCDNRALWCKIFNDPRNTRARLFLISTRAGGLGINLVAANRVIIFDVSWNPSHDIQSIYRVYRFGQKKPCYIYRFVTQGTMEMKIYERQVTKQAISKRVVDEQQIDRHYNQNDLMELYNFEPTPEDRPIPLVPKDVLLGELLQNFEDRVYSYHEHQSLLENKEEECLNEEERKAAWEEFENEKKARQNYSTASSSYNPMIHIENALANIIRRENPILSEAEIKSLVPTMQMQLQEQMAKGDLILYRRVQQEIQLMQAIRNQQLKEQYYREQAIRMLQQQQLQQRWLNQYGTQYPGTSQNQFPSTTNNNPNEVIDLND